MVLVDVFLSNERSGVFQTVQNEAGSVAGQWNLSQKQRRCRRNKVEDRIRAQGVGKFGMRALAGVEPDEPFLTSRFPNRRELASD